MSCFHPHCQMYHVWAVNGEFQCYQWCLFLLIGCSKRVFTAWSVRTPFNVVPSACSPTQMATSFHNPSLPWTISLPPITRIHPRKVWHDSFIHFVYASRSYSSPWSIPSFMSSTVTQSTKLDCWPPRPYDHPFDCFCFKCLPRSHIAHPYRKRSPTVTLDPEVGSFISTITFKGLKH